MKFWTIQTVEAWNQAVSKGYLVGHREYIFEDFLDGYLWMMSEMKKRLPHYSGEFPIWLWTKKPDLRLGGKLNRGQHGVLLEVELNHDDVLISDFMAWHIVLSNGFLALTEEEDNEFNKGTLSMTKEQSWSRIFDYQEIKRFEYWVGEEKLQAVTGKIEISRLKKIKEFIER